MNGIHGTVFQITFSGFEWVIKGLEQSKEKPTSSKNVISAHLIGVQVEYGSRKPSPDLKVMIYPENIFLYKRISFYSFRKMRKFQQVLQGEISSS